MRRECIFIELFPRHATGAGKQELIDEAWDTSPSYQQQQYTRSNGDGFVSHDSQISVQMPQAPLPPHLSVPENWDQQLGQLGSEFGDEFDQAQPQLDQRKRQLYADPAADLDKPMPKRARQSPPRLEAPPHLLEDENGMLLQPPLPDGPAVGPAAAKILWNSSPAAAKPMPGVSPSKPSERSRSLSSALARSSAAPGSAAPSASPLGKAALEARLQRVQQGTDSKALPRSASAIGEQPSRQANGGTAQHNDVGKGGMASYGPAFLQKAIVVFDEGRVSVNAKILKSLIPKMDPAEAYTGLAWAGWCIAQNTLPETQMQVGKITARTKSALSYS